MANVSTDSKFVTSSNLRTTVERISDKINNHGTHVTYGTITPKANGSATPGTSSKVSREDHVHPLQTSVSGNAGSANKVNNSIKIQLNGGTTEGTNQFTFDGSAAKSINITPSAIGAAKESHGNHVTYSTDAPKADGTASAGSSAAVARADHVHPIQTAVSGNAGSATKLQTARKINGTSFDGSGDITTANWGTTRSITIGNTSKNVNGSTNYSWTKQEIGFIQDSEINSALTDVFGSSYMS